jgi:hypothetical protein
VGFPIWGMTSLRPPGIMATVNCPMPVDSESGCMDSLETKAPTRKESDDASIDR